MRQLIRGFLIFCLFASIHAAGKTASDNGGTDNATLTVNQLETSISNDGGFYRVSGNVRTAGITYASGTERYPLLYAGGLWIVGKVDGQIRAGANYYGGNFQPGPLDANGLPADPGDALYHIYRYGRGETPAQAAQALGCPSTVLGDSMFYTVYNDSSGGQVLSWGADNPGFTPHLGVEVRQTVFAYAPGTQPHLEHCIFSRYEIIYRGTETVDSAFISLFLDGDIGNSGDDLAGTDIARQMVYAWNGDDNDEDFFGSEIPALGGVLLDGPLPMGTTYFEVSGGHITGMSGARNFDELWAVMRGLRNTGEAWETPDSETTVFPFAGDPLTGTGWLFIDGVGRAGESNMHLSCGPHTLQPGDTLRYTFALVAGQPGATPLDAVQNLRDNVDAIQTFYDEHLGKTTAVAETEPPRSLDLVTAFPNPFNPQTTIQVHMPQAGTLKLEIFDIRGRNIATLAHAPQPAGKSTWTWHAGDLPSGVYLCRATAGKKTSVHKLLLQK